MNKQDLSGERAAILASKKKWNNLTDEERAFKIAALFEVCKGLTDLHQDYKNFKSVTVTCIEKGATPSDNMCLMRWNGNRMDEVTGWGLVKREIPAHAVPSVTKRYSDRLRNLDSIEDD